MKPSLAIKTLLRSPGKTLFTFLLITVLTFSLFLQLAEYQATAREFAENVDMYYGTGYVEKSPAVLAGYGKLQYPYYLATDPRVDTSDLPDLSGFHYPALSQEEVAEIAALPYISSAEQRYMTAGRGAYPRLRDDDSLWDYNARAVIEGTLTGNCYAAFGCTVGSTEAQGMRLADSKLLAGDLDMELFTAVAPRWRSSLGFYLEFTEDFQKGYPDYMPPEIPVGEVEDGELFFNLSPATTNGEHTFFNGFRWGSAADRYFFMQDDWIPNAEKEDFNTSADSWGGYCNVILKNYPYDLDVQNRWNTGDRFVFVFRFSRNPNPTEPVFQALSLNLYDWSSEHFCPAVWNITDAPENYLEKPEYAPLKKLIEITESDLNTLDVVYTGNMRTIKLVHDGKMVLTEGRWLTPEDTENQARVCMLDENFAKTYDLQVGDTLSLELGDMLFEQFYNLGAIANTEERYADNWTDTAFEIVGLYSTSGGAYAAAQEPNWSYSVNTVFVPLSALPETVDLTDHEFAPGEITIQVENAWDIAAFLEETAPQIEDMGLTLRFDDGGWMEVYTTYAAAQRVALVRIGVLAAVTVLATAFVVYLFISRKRKDYAIMRALGTPKRQSGVALLLPLLVLAAVSVAAGLAAAAVYIGRMDGLGQPSLGMALLCGGGELLLTLLLALGLLRGLSRQSPLALLQGGTQAGKIAQPAPQITKTENVAVQASVPLVGAGSKPALAPVRGKPHSVRFVLRYIFRHMRRSAVKSLLSVLVAALMLAAVAQLGYMRGVYERLRTDTVVTAKFNNSLILPKCKDLEAEGLTDGLYYVRNLDGVIVLDYGETPEIRIGVTNDIETYVGGACEVQYAPGHGPADMGVTGKYVLLGKTLMEEQGIALGDTVRLCKQYDTDMFFQTESRRLQKKYPGQYPDERSSLWAVWPEETEQALDQLCDCLTVIGSVNTGNNTYDGMVFTPGLETTKKFMMDNLLEYAEFRISDNTRALELKHRGEELTNHRAGEFSIDLEKLESVERTAALLETLYPIVIALALVIGGFLCVLIILQSTKDAAIMRILGTTKRKTRAMLSLEQILLALFGLLLGLTVMAAVHRAAFVSIVLQAGLFAGAYLLIAAAASLVSAGIATQKKLLELLQTKE